MGVGVSSKDIRAITACAFFNRYCFVYNPIWDFSLKAGSVGRFEVTTLLDSVRVSRSRFLLKPGGVKRFCPLLPLPQISQNFSYLSLIMIFSNPLAAIPLSSFHFIMTWGPKEKSGLPRTGREGMA